MTRQEIIKELEDEDILYTIEKNCVSCDLLRLADFISSALDKTREETIREIRKHDEAELIKMLPVKNGRTEQLIKDYYEK